MCQVSIVVSQGLNTFNNLIWTYGTFVHVERESRRRLNFFFFLSISINTTSVLKTLLSFMAVYPPPPPRAPTNDKDKTNKVGDYP